MSDYMNTYISGGKKFRAWSEMRCDEGYGDVKEIHEPHVWNSPHTVYGPYFCPGRPDPDAPRGDI